MRGWKLLLSRISGVNFLLMGIVSATLGVLGAGGFFETWGFPPLFRTVMNFFAGILMLVVIVLGIASLVYRIYLRRTIHRYPGYHSLSHCTVSDIRDIATVAGNIFTGATSLDETMALYHLDPGIFTAVRERNQKILGYICIIRLTTEGVRAILSDNFSIKRVNDTYIRTDNNRRGGDLYIGAVWGEDLKARACALYGLLGILRESAPARVFARAATADGLRLLQRYGFAPVKAHRATIGEIFVWHRPVA